MEPFTRTLSHTKGATNAACLEKDFPRINAIMGWIAKIRPKVGGMIRQIRK